MDSETSLCLEKLLNRRSSARLVDPSPTHKQLELLIRAALRAADHASLQPWEFLVFDGDNRTILGDALVQGALANDADLSLEQQHKVKNKCYRAPLILIAVSKNKQHPKVPVWEQELSTAAACQNILNAAYMMGLGAYWRTGSAVFNPVVSKALGIQQPARIVGFIYLGTPHNNKLPTTRANDNWRDFVRFMG